VLQNLLFFQNVSEPRTQRSGVSGREARPLTPLRARLGGHTRRVFVSGHRLSYAAD